LCESNITDGGLVSGGPLIISNDALTEDTGRFTPSSAVTLTLAVEVGHPGTFQSKLRTDAAGVAIVLNETPSGENSTR
jgi:hypothetical protein